MAKFSHSQSLSPSSLTSKTTLSYVPHRPTPTILLLPFQQPPLKPPPPPYLSVIISSAPHITHGTPSAAACMLIFAHATTPPTSHTRLSHSVEDHSIAPTSLITRCETSWCIFHTSRWWDREGLALRNFSEKHTTSTEIPVRL
jgi:hypothetical protein